MRGWGLGFNGDLGDRDRCLVDGNAMHRRRIDDGIENLRHFLGCEHLRV